VLTHATHASCTLLSGVPGSTPPVRRTRALRSRYRTGHTESCEEVAGSAVALAVGSTERIHIAPGHSHRGDNHPAHPPCVLGRHRMVGCVRGQLRNLLRGLVNTPPSPADAPPPRARATRGSDGTIAKRHSRSTADRRTFATSAYVRARRAERTHTGSSRRLVARSPGWPESNRDRVAV
jgi:hypothetical protein